MNQSAEDRFETDDWTPGDLDWRRSARLDSIRDVRRKALAHARWLEGRYARYAAGVRGWAKACRWGAIFLAGVAGIVPLVDTIFHQQIQLSGVWTTFFVALAAGFATGDRLLGFSTSWMRYVQTEIRIRSLTGEYAYASTRDAAGWHDPPTDTEIQRGIDRARGFLRSLDEVVQSETSSWVREFNSALTELDTRLRSSSSAAAAGLRVTVENASELDAGWIVRVDGAERARGAGESGVVAGLPPGSHTVEAVGNIRGRAASATTDVTLDPGETELVVLKLEPRPGKDDPGVRSPHRPSVAAGPGAAPAPGSAEELQGSLAEGDPEEDDEDEAADG